MGEGGGGVDFAEWARDRTQAKIRRKKKETIYGFKKATRSALIFLRLHLLVCNGD